MACLRTWSGLQMKVNKWAVFLAVTLCAAVSACEAASPGPAQDAELLEAAAAFKVSARLLNDRTAEVRYTIVDGYYMYRDRFQFEINGQPLVLDKKAWPAGKVKKDATFGKVVTYRHSVLIRLPLPSASAGTDGLSLLARSQGCADVGVCYPPLQQTVALYPGDSAWTLPAEETVSGFSRDRASGKPLMDRLTQGK